MKTICAWCPGFDPDDPANAGATHGICQDCSDRLIFEAVQRIRLPQPRDRRRRPAANSPERTDDDE